MMNLQLREQMRCTREEKLACVPLINEIVGLAKVARKEGILYFDKYKAAYGDKPLLQVGLKLCCDGLDRQSIAYYLEDMIEGSETTGADLLRQLIIANGIIDIMNGDNPRFVRTHLCMMLGEEVYNEAMETKEGGLILLDAVDKAADSIWDIRWFLNEAKKANEAYNFDTMDDDMLAFLLLKVGDTLAARIFETLDEQRKKSIIHTMLSIDFTKTDMIIKIQDHLNKWKLEHYDADDFLRINNIRMTADMLRLVSRETRRDILGDIKKTDTDLCEKIKDSMFAIEDFANLDTPIFGRVIRDLTSKDIATIILWRNNLKPVIFSRISGGLAEMIEDDMENIKATRDDFDAAVKKIAGVIRKLANQGDIYIDWWY